MIRVQMGTVTIEVQNSDIRLLPMERMAYRTGDLFDALAAVLRAIDPNGEYTVQRGPGGQL